MNEEFNEPIENWEKSSTEIVPTELHILVTSEDQIGSDITKMSNFFEEYVKQMTTSIQSNAVVDIVKDFPLVDIGVLGEVVQYAKAIVAGEYSLLPDFDHLPTDIREKLKKGIYTVGESRQVELLFLMKVELVSKILRLSRLEMIQGR